MGRAKPFKNGYLLIAIMVVSMMTVFTLGQQPASTPDAQTLKMLSIAESQHEIVQLLIQKGEYEKALDEYRAILDLKLPAAYDEAVFKEIVIVARKFYDANQKELAYQALDLGFDRLKSADLKAKILSVKAGLLKKDGRIERAIETYKKEIELREKQIR